MDLNDCFAAIHNFIPMKNSIHPQLFIVKIEFSPITYCMIWWASSFADLSLYRWFATARSRATKRNKSRNQNWAMKEVPRNFDIHPLSCCKFPFYYPPSKIFWVLLSPRWKLNWCIDTPIHGQFYILSSFSVRASRLNYLFSIGPFELHIPLSSRTFLQSVHSYDQGVNPGSGVFGTVN